MKNSPMSFGSKISMAVESVNEESIVFDDAIEGTHAISDCSPEVEQEVEFMDCETSSRVA